MVLATADMEWDLLTCVYTLHFGSKACIVKALSEAFIAVYFVVFEQHK